MLKLKKYCNKGGFNFNNYFLMFILEINLLLVLFFYMESGVRNFFFLRYC